MFESQRRSHDSRRRRRRAEESTNCRPRDPQITCKFSATVTPTPGPINNFHDYPDATRKPSAGTNEAKPSSLVSRSLSARLGAPELSLFPHNSRLSSAQKSKTSVRSSDHPPCTLHIPASGQCPWPNGVEPKQCATRSWSAISPVTQSRCNHQHKQGHNSPAFATTSLPLPNDNWFPRLCCSWYDTGLGLPPCMIVPHHG